MTDFDPKMSMAEFIRSGRQRTIDAAVAAAAPVVAPADPVVEPKAAGTPVEKGAFVVYKADKEAGVIYTFASAAGITDKDNEVVPIADLIAMAHGFVAKGGAVFNANHGQDHYDLSKAELVESIVGAPILKSGRVIKLGEELPPADEDPVVGMNIEKGQESYWLLGIRPNNADVLEAAKKGGIVGASWEGFCNKVAPEVTTNA